MAELSALERRLERRKKFETNAREWKNGTKESVHAMEVGLSVVVGALLGFVIDKNFDLLPWGTLIGCGFGVIAGARTLYRISRKIIADGEREDAERRG